MSNGTLTAAEAHARATTLLTTASRWPYAAADGHGVTWRLPAGPEVRLSFDLDLLPGSAKTGLVGMRFTLTANGSLTGPHITAAATVYSEALTEAARALALAEGDLATYRIRVAPAVAANGRFDPDEWENAATTQQHHHITCKRWKGAEARGPLIIEPCDCGGQAQWEELMNARSARREPRDLTKREAVPEAKCIVHLPSRREAAPLCGAAMNRGDSLATVDVNCPACIIASSSNRAGSRR